MKIYYRKTNRGEKYCCSVKSAKEHFKSTEITINFGDFGRTYKPFPNEPGYAYFKKNIKGIIVSSLSVEYGGCNPRLSFYVVKESEFSSDLQVQFEGDILNKLLEFYNAIIRSKDRFVCVLIELLNNQLLIHKNTLK